MNTTKKPVSNKRRPAFWTATLGVTGLAVAAGIGLLAPKNLPADEANITVYKSPTCGCCIKWVDHLKDNGFTVDVRERRNMQPVKKEFGVDSQYQSCHTATIDGYVIEGHVPASDIKRLLTEKTNIKGLVVPGMPMGSPGMEGPRTDRYSVLAIDHDGQPSVYKRY